ncbi:hypothetical protein AWB64_00980 [Caballeronia sordidicola]|uniref:Sensory transduction regulator n=1 Tax=Caballeronia sordidicola TaxID=196367 RepID=A0A158F9X9_CABSO|nr:hypothetical protein [Caballeronia sordidicola]SAL16443.1 hypothetical protein AWB64_00980 [Caballeronia sordidicola]
MLVWTEDQITLELLSDRLTDSGLSIVSVDENRIGLKSESGIWYSVSVVDDPKFIRLWSFLPLRNEESKASKVHLEHLLNGKIFLPVFSLDADEDLTVSYAMPYAQGLIAGQFAAIVQRFGSMLQYVVQSHNESGLIDFNKRSTQEVSITLN